MRRSPIRRQRPCYTVHRFVFKNWVRFLKRTWQLNLPLPNFRVPFLIVVFLLVSQASQPIREPRSTCSVDWQAASLISPPPTRWTKSASSCVGLRNMKTEVSLWKRIKCFPFTLRGRNLKLNNQRSFWICVSGREIVNWSFPKTFVFKMFFVYTKTQRERFQIPPLWRAFTKRSVFVAD